jgi:hypothetical protein
MSERGDGVETVEVETAAGTTPAGREAAGGEAAGGVAAGGEELGKVRELVLKAHPDVVPDLVRGSSVDELIASVEPARSAYQRIADQVRKTETVAAGEVGSRKSEETSNVRPPTSDPIVPQPPTVPAGGGTNVAEPGDLGPTTKIAQALAARKQR